MSMSENIKKLRSIFGVTQDELGEIAGVTGNAVSQWENGRSEPRMGAIERMAACYGISKSNIIEDGGMDAIDPITKRPRAFIPDSAMSPNKEPKKAYAPLLGRVHAGDAQEPDIIDDCIPIPFEVKARHANAYFLEVEGDCMNKVYPEGCHILIDPDKEPRSGSIAVVSIDGSDYIMRRILIGANTLVLSPDSTNQKWSDIVISGNDHTVEMVGTVVWYQPSRELE